MPSGRQFLALVAAFGGGTIASRLAHPNDLGCRSVHELDDDPTEWSALLVAHTESESPRYTRPWNVAYLLDGGPSRLDSLLLDLGIRQYPTDPVRTPISAIKTLVPCAADRGRSALPLDERSHARLAEFFTPTDDYAHRPDDGAPQYYFELPERHDGVIVVELVDLHENETG